MDKYFQDYTVALISELKAISPPSYVPPDDGAKQKWFLQGHLCPIQGDTSSE